MSQRLPRWIVVSALFVAGAGSAIAQAAEESPAYYFAIAKTYAAEGSYREAVEAFRKAIELEPEDPYIRMAYAELLVRTGRARQAAEVADEALALAPENHDALRLVGEVRLELASRDPRSLRAAKDAYETLRKLEPEDISSLLTLARIYLGENEPAKALEVLEEASDYSPNHPAVQRGLLEALVRSGDDERALEILPRLLRRNPSFLEGRLSLARILSASGDHDGAIRILEAAPPEDLQRTDTRYLVASELYRRAMAGAPTRAAELADLKRALDLSDGILAEQPTHLEAQHLRGLVLAEQARRAEAIEQLQNLYEVAPQDLRIRVATKLSELLEQEGRTEQAAALLSELAEDLTNANGRAIVADRVWLEVAQLHERHEEWSELASVAQRLQGAGEIALRQEGVLLAAKALRGLGQPEEALQHLRRHREEFERTTRLDLAEADVLFELGRDSEAGKMLAGLIGDGQSADLLAVTQFYLDRGDEAKVVPLLETLVGREDDPDLPPAMRREVLLLLADTLLGLDRADEALQALDQADPALLEDAERLDRRRLDLEKARALEAVGRTSEADRIVSALADEADVQAALLVVQYYQRGERYDRMLPALEKALARASASGDQGGDLDLYFSLGVAHERLGDYPSAEKAFRSALAIDASDGRTLNYLGYMWADRSENLDEALEMISQAVSLEPDNGAYLDSLGWVYYRLGRYKEARGYLESAAQRQPEDATILEHLGDVYLALEIPAKARELYRRALAKQDENVEGLRRKLAQLGPGDA